MKETNLQTKIKDVILRSVLKSIKILIFDSKLNWFCQTVCVIEKANKAKQAQYILSIYFFTVEMLKLAKANDK